MKTAITMFVLLPFVAFSQSPYFTAFGQLALHDTEPTAKIPEPSIAVRLGYGGGADFNVHLSESVIWLTTLVFEVNPLEDDNLGIDGFRVKLDGKYSVDNIPVLTGVAFEKLVGQTALAAWAQVGISYCEFPSISGYYVGDPTNKFDSIIDGEVNFGFSIGARMTYKKFAIGIRYMDFGDYTFSGTYKSSTSALDRDVQFKTSLYYLAISLGYNIELSGDQ